MFEARHLAIYILMRRPGNRFHVLLDLLYSTLPSRVLLTSTVKEKVAHGKHDDTSKANRWYLEIFECLQAGTMLAKKNLFQFL